MTKPANKSYLLATMHGLLGVGAIVGGLMLMIDPSGSLLNMPVSLLENSPFSHFFIPGMILLLVLGVVPIVVCIALLKRSHWSLAEKLNLYSDRHWAWTFSLYTGYALLVWIFAQVYFIQSVTPIHLFYFAWGLGIQIVTLLPETQRGYAK
ncbi:hypothetical protein Q9R46_16695 [Paenibacillus sp. RRE4]|uniref:hypothetical protein n=1 Tax=Paenibacillus sp. RRE4 TaxID=2962587 RepID=UPI0028829C58|nr:hypothetical protein [Paenibacillus sp. RRE4]MDT0124299.1 hypothetical protein [Paenibacillus sp. RRE4]